MEQIGRNIFDVSESRVSHMMRSFIRFLHRQIASIVWIFLKSLPDISHKSNHVDHIISQLIYTAVPLEVDTLRFSSFIFHSIEDFEVVKSL